MNDKQSFGSTIFGRPRRQRFSLGGMLFTVVFGVVFVGIGTWVLTQATQISPDWVRVQGEVTDAQSSRGDSTIQYSPVISYEVDGMIYEVLGGYTSSTRPAIGQAYEVAYNPADPSNAKPIHTLGVTWWLWPFPILGVLIAFAGVWAYMKGLRRGSVINHLKATGLKVEGVAVGTESSTMRRTGQATALRLVVAATDNQGTVRQYVSDPLDGASSLLVEDFKTNPVAVDVYIDPQDPERYYVDIDDIPQLSTDRIKQLLEQAKNGVKQSK